MSPIAPKGFADPDTLHRDFSVLAGVYKPDLVYLTGGEPLLHPDIVSAIRAVRATGISDQIRILTNGVLLSRMNDDFWTHIDQLEISVYPNSGIDDLQLQRYQDQARAHGVRLEVYRFTTFRRSFSLQGTSDTALVRRLYRACKAAHVWGCHYVHEGYLFRCPQSAFMPRLLPGEGSQPHVDGLRLQAGPGLRDELFRYLTSTEPLRACSHCLGQAGIQRPVTHVSPRAWRTYQDESTESLVDYQELARNEAELHIQDVDAIKTLVR